MRFWVKARVSISFFPSYDIKIMRMRKFAYAQKLCKSGVVTYQISALFTFSLFNAKNNQFHGKILSLTKDLNALKAISAKKRI